MAIKSEISLDSSKAEAEASRAGASIAGKLAKSSQGNGKGLFGGAEKGMNAIMAGSAKLGVAFYAMQKAVDFGDELRDLEDGLQSVLPSGQNLVKEMEELVEISHSPGLRFDSVVKAHTSFLSLGKSAAESKDLILNLGNALEGSGRESTQLPRVVEILTRIKDAGGPTVKSLHALAEEATLFRVAMQRGFGKETVEEIEAMGMSADKFLTGLTAGLHGLDRAGKDAKDRLGDLNDTMKHQGQQVINGYIDSMQEGLGGWAQAFNAVQNMFRKTEDRDFGSGATKEIVARKKAAEEAQARSKNEAAENIAAIERETKARISGLQDVESMETDLAISKMKEKEGTEAEKSDQKDITDALTLKLRLQKDLAALMKSQQISEQAAVDLIKTQVENARLLSDEQEKLAAAKKKVNQDDDLAKRKRDADIMEAKSKGHGGKAERLQKAADLADKQKELEGLGMSPDAAKKRAAEEVRISEDAAFREKTGRSRIHGGARVATGLTPKTAGDLDRRVGDQEYGRLDAMGRTQATARPMATTKLTAGEVAGSQTGAQATKAMEGLTAALKNLEQAAKKYNASNLNSAN